MATRFEKMVNAAKKNASEISPRKAAEAAEKGGALIIDVRDPDESQAAYVPNAKTISRGTLEIEIEELAPDTSTPIICYCGGGGRSALAAESLQRMGYTNVKSMAGGFKAWQAEGLPVER
ncbi:MAG: sulfurtransferase [Verrucomicrobia bacterium]|nr:MAG: sulfurtransferase [Verrucomicrobiota bacterium]